MKMNETALIVKNENNTEIYACKGVLISKRVVLTPHYCIKPNLEGLVSVDLGNINPAEKENCRKEVKCSVWQRYDIEEIILNPNYSEPNMRGDIAMLRLEKDVVYGKYVQPICLPSAVIAQNELVTKHLYVAGYPHGPHEIKKIKTFAQIVERERCKKDYSYEILSEHICALMEHQLPFTTGSVLMDVKVENGEPKNFYLVGLLTHYSEKSFDIPLVFTSAAPFLDWIKKNL